MQQICRSPFDFVRIFIPCKVICNRSVSPFTQYDVSSLDHFTLMLYLITPQSHVHTDSKPKDSWPFRHCRLVCLGTACPWSVVRRYGIGLVGVTEEIIHPWCYWGISVSLNGPLINFDCLSIFQAHLVRVFELMNISCIEIWIYLI